MRTQRALFATRSAKSQIAQKNESHYHRPDFSTKDLRYVYVHHCVAASSLERQIEEDEECAYGIASTIRIPRIGGSHSREHRCCSHTSHKAHEIYAPTAEMRH